VRKLQAEKLGLYKPTVVDLDRTLRRVKGQYSTVPGREVAIRYAPSCGCRVMANGLLAEVFSNLVGNAIKHSEGPIIVDIGLQAVSEDGKRYCKVTVSDNGPGIPDRMKKKLFDRLCLLKAKAGGKGFGLCLVKMLLDDFGGRFYVEDRVPGDYTKGCRFVVLLPAI
jgi:signal transduction histidine kinase